MDWKVSRVEVGKLRKLTETVLVTIGDCRGTVLRGNLGHIVPVGKERGKVSAFFRSLEHKFSLG